MTPLFDRIRWIDPISGAPLTPVVVSRTPGGVPIHGAMRIGETNRAYPIVDSIVRATPEAARKHARWLEPLGLEPPGEAGSFQEEASVDSFGFQWSWTADMRNEDDLRWRVASRFGVDPAEFAGKTVLDAGAGAGDQSRWLLGRGADVVSVDLSAAIDVVAAKLRLEPNWVGIQGDVTALPLAPGQFDVVYCEGVIQHTRDSAATVRELLRVAAAGGRILATHYPAPERLPGRLRVGALTALRRRLSRMERYKLLFVAGVLAASAYLPLVGWLVRRFGLAIHQPAMPRFRTTWTNTFDMYGNHTYQRVISADTFWSYFRAAGAEQVFRAGTTVVARKT
jgi:SAM-dependent methyltransferase